MSCKAGGNPPPEVHWTKEGGGLVSQGKTVMAGSGLVLASVTREDEGLYICTASNGVGAPASTSVKLTVLCKFEIIPPGLTKTALGISVTFYSSADCSVLSSQFSQCIFLCFQTRLRLSWRLTGSTLVLTRRPTSPAESRVTRSPKCPGTKTATFSTSRSQSVSGQRPTVTL